MKKYIVDIRCDNAAFQGEARLEVLRILKKLTGDLERIPELANAEANLYDLNGKLVGYAKFDENSPSVFEKKQEVGDQPMLNEKSPNRSTPAPKVPWRDRARKAAQELTDNLNRNVLAEHQNDKPPEPVELSPQEKARRLQDINESNRRLGRKTLSVVPLKQPHSPEVEKMLVSLRKSYPGVSDEELIRDSHGLL